MKNRKLRKSIFYVEKQYFFIEKIILNCGNAKHRSLHTHIYIYIFFLIFDLFQYWGKVMLVSHWYSDDLLLKGIFIYLRSFKPNIHTMT